MTPKTLSQTTPKEFFNTIAEQETVGYLGLNGPSWPATADRLRRDPIPFLRQRA